MLEVKITNYTERVGSQDYERVGIEIKIDSMQKDASQSWISAVLLQSGLDEKWLADSMECYCSLRNVQDLLADGKTPYERRFGEPFEGPVISFDAMVEYHPIFCKRPVGIQTLMN